MLDLVQLSLSCALAAGLSAAVLLLAAWPWREPRAGRVAAGWAFGLGLGFVAGCWVLEVRLAWPPGEDLHRLLLIVVPAVVIVEWIAAIPRVPRWLAWSLRGMMALGVLPILLFDSVYVTDLSGPGSRQWTMGEEAAWVAAAGGLLLVVWLLLAARMTSRPGRVVSLALSLTAGASALTVMLSGYLTGGLVGVPLSAAVAGAVLASFAIPRGAIQQAGLGVALVCLFSVLAVGRFFADLTILHAMVLLGAPVLMWVAEAPLINRLRPWTRDALALGLLLVVLGAVVSQAYVRHAEESAPVPGTSEPSVDDNLNFKP